MTTTARFPETNQITIGRLEASLGDVHRLRLNKIRAGKWPHWSDAAWHDRADRARRSGDVSGPAVRAIETSRALREAEAKRQGSAA